MTIVIETAAGIDPPADPSFSQIITHFHLSTSSKPQVFGERAFHYYQCAEADDPQKIITQLRQIPGVEAAYIQPEGTPPTL